MKAKKILILTAIIPMFLGLSSCRTKEIIDDDLYIPNIAGYYPSPEEMTELDYWIEENITLKYNVQVIYRWDAAYMNTNILRKLVPVEEDRVRPCLELVEKVWFEPYIKIKNDDPDFPRFIIQYAPKTLLLIGSAQYEDRGKVMGLAEGANLISLLELNHVDFTKASDVRSLLHVIQHEFAHILQQTVSPIGFEKISKNYDSGKWTSLGGDAVANELGFITAYASSADSEDFVEMISNIIVYGYEWFENVVLRNAAKGGEEPVRILREKEQYIETYLRDVWDINLFDQGTEPGLITLVQRAIDSITY